MADIDTSFYPRAQQQNSLVETAAQLQSIQNAQQQNKLLQLEQQRQGIGITQDQVNLAHQRYGILSGALGTLAQDPRIATPEGMGLLKQTTEQLVKTGIISPEIANAEMANAPQDPSQLPQYLQTLNTRVLDGQSKFGQIYGTPTTISNGSVTLPVTISSTGGVRPIAAPFQQTLSPETRADLVPGTNAQGQQTLTPKGNLLQQSGMNPMTAQPQGNMLAAPQGSAQTFSQPGQPQGGSVAMTPPAGEVEAQSAVAKSSADKFATDQGREANFQTEVLPLTKSISELQKLGTTGTGPGTETINDWKSFAQSMGLGPIAGIDPDKIQSYDEARKYLTSYARTVGDTGTNDKLAAAFAGNPSTGISNAAAVDVAKTALSMRRLQNAQVRAFASSSQSPSKYNQFTSEFNAAQDPVAYGFDLMEPKERLKYYQGLSAADKQKFMGSLKTATSLGLVNAPSAGNQ